MRWRSRGSHFGRLSPCWSLGGLVDGPVVVPPPHRTIASTGWVSYERGPRWSINNRHSCRRRTDGRLLLRLFRMRDEGVGPAPGTARRRRDAIHQRDGDPSRIPHGVFRGRRSLPVADYRLAAALAGPRQRFTAWRKSVVSSRRDSGDDPLQRAAE